MDKYKFETHPIANPGAIIQGPNYRFTLLKKRLIRFEWAEDNQFEDRASTFAIDRKFSVPEFRVVDGDELQIITDHFHLSYTKQKFSPESLIIHFSGKSVKYGTPWRFGTPTEFNLGGTARTLDGVDGRCDMGQGVLSKAGYAVIDDSKSMLFDGKGFVAPRKPGERFDCYLFCYGREYKDAIKAFYAVSGKQPVVPRFALGNWWSRYYAYHQDEYVALMDKFKAHNIPMSVAVLDMDWHYVSDDRVPHAGWTGYTWDEKVFPDPKKFRKDMHARGLKVTLNDHPHGGIHNHEDAYEEMARFLGHDTSTGNPILFDPVNAKFMEAYFDILHRRLEDDACDFWWVDWQQGPYSKVPGFDPLWLLNHFQYLDSTQEGRIPLIFSRYGGPGSHRYPVGFSGDTVVSWESLAFQPEFTATASNIGYGWWSHDIGGHIRGVRDDELLARWTQLGVFSPIMRLHSTSSRWMSKEPWLYGEEYSKAMSKFLRFRHILAPYLYNENMMGSVTDEPLIQPMYWSYPYHNEAYEVPNQYYLGSALLVAPIVQPRDKRTNLASARAWLPPGQRFMDLFTGTLYGGGRGITFYRPIDQYPVLAAEGAIISLDSVEDDPPNGCPTPKHLDVVVIVGQDGLTYHFEEAADDIPSSPEEGVTNSQVSTRETKFEFIQETGEFTATDVSQACTFRFPWISGVQDGQAAPTMGPVGHELYPIVERYRGVPCLSYHLSLSAAQRRQEDGVPITIELGPDPQLRVQDHTDHLEELIRGYQIEFQAKDKLWAVIESAKGQPLKAVSSLLWLGYEEAIVGPLVELLLADDRPVDA